MLRYSILRMMIFLGCLAALWLVGLREPAELPWLVVAAAISSMIISAIVLQPFRAEAVRSIQERQAARARARGARTDTDEAVEDAARRDEPVADEGPETYR